MVETNPSASVKCPYFQLNSGYKAPAVAFGSGGIKDCKDIIVKAILQHGYRHIDTASIYGNEEAIGEALQECFKAGIKREDIFITTKLWHNQKNDISKAAKDSLARLQLDYLDLYLVHFMRPEVDWSSENWDILSPPNHVVWQGMEALVETGLVKSIGVSNCTMPVLFDLIAGCEIRPAVNQIECHPYFQQSKVLEFHQKFNVTIQCYASIGATLSSAAVEQNKSLRAIDDPLLKEIAERKGKTVVQVITAWHVARKCLLLAKTTNESRLLENIEGSYDVQLSQEDIEAIGKIDRGMRLFDPKHMSGFDMNNMPYFD